MNLNDSKKVCVVSPGLYPCVTGGAEVFNEALIRSLSADCDVTYITECDETIANTKKISIPKMRPSFQLFFIVSRLFCIEKGRVIITSFMRTKWYYVVFYPIFNLVMGRSYIVIVHGGGMARWGFAAPYVWYFRRAKKVFGVSELICREYKARTGVDVSYLPPMVPITVLDSTKYEMRRSKGFNEKDVIFLWVGSLKKLKNPMVVLRAIDDLGVKFLGQNSIKFLFAGDGVLKPEMREFVDKNGLSKFVHLLGNVPRSDIPYLYRLSDAYVIASDFEGTPISMLEAMANGLLVIGSDVPGINTIISHGDSGFLFDRGDVGGLAKLIKMVSVTGESSVKERARSLFMRSFSYEKTLLSIKAVL